MTTQPRHDRLDERPFWTVQSVFDPEGGGSDFAYTIGLHERGRPELHLWARPDRGDDPGDDWMLSPNDRCHLLNELAWQLLRGDLAVGQTVTRELDAGAVTMEMEIGPPRDPESLDAFQAHPEAVVWPVSWSLTRPPEGANEPLDGPALAQAEADFRAAVGLIDTGLIDTGAAGAVPAGWEVPSRPSYDPEQVFGPRTPVVLARATLLWQADATSLNRLAHCAANADVGGSLTLPISVARTAARAVGRRTALEQLQRAVDEAVEWLGEDPTRGPRWAELLASLYGDDIVGEPGERASAHRTTARLVSEVLLACLAVDVVADVIEPRWLLAGRGPFLAALGRPQGELPGPEWTASSEVLAVTLSLLQPLTASQLTQVAALHERAMIDQVPAWPNYSEISATLHGWSLVEAAGCPWRSCLDTLPAWEEFRARYHCEVELTPIPALQEWASCLTAALTHRARLSDEEVRAFVTPFGELLPALEGMLNTPVARASE